MLNSVSPETRNAIAHARRHAMAGQEQVALDQLEGLRPKTAPSPVDHAAVLLTKAELLYIAGKYRASYEVFVNELDSLVPSLPHPVAIVVGFDRCDVAMSLFDSAGMSRFYDLLDEQHIAGLEHWNDSAMLSATSSAARGRSYESLPTIWRELLRTYRQGRWAAFRQASRYMADECVRIGLPQEAAFHAANAFDGDFAKQIGGMLVNSRNATAVDATITKLLLTANLQRHFCVACELFQALSDVVPDSLVDRVLSWVLLRCASVEAPEDHYSTNTLAWKTIESLVARASADTAGRIMEIAITHPAWNAMPAKADQFIPVREEIIDAMKETAAALPTDMLRRLADAAIPIATDRRNFKDFDHAVSLLSHISYRSSEDIKAKIASALYRSGEKIPPVLMQAAPFFGQEIPNRDGQLEKYAMQVANSIGQIVQHVAKGEEPKPVDGTIMTWTSEKENGRLVVHLVSTESIWGLARNKRQVPVEACRAVIVALLKAISDRDILLDNKITFINCLKGFADCMDTSLAAEVFGVLAPIVGGKIESSPDIASAMSQSHPLSRITVKSTTEEQVAAQALFVLACIEHSSPGTYGARLQAIVRKALDNNSPAIRRCAFAAVREIPAFAESTWMPLLLGTRDPDFDAAALAFDAISAKQNAHLTRAQWKMMVYSFKIAQLSTSIKLRKAAASAVSRLEPQASSKALRGELSAIRESFARDIAHSVRAAADVTQEAAGTT